MRKSEKTRWIVGNALLVALCVVLTLISNYIPIGGITINLALITIALAAILYGYKSALFVGAVNGIVVMFAAQAFFAISPVGTVIVCLLKSGLAGLISALVYNLLKNKNHHLGVILATILVPIVNTFIFIIGSLIFFNGVFGQLISLFIAANFIIEFVINLLLSPSIYYIVNLFKKRKA